MKNPAPTTAAPHDRLDDRILDIIHDMDTADIVDMWNVYVNDHVNAPDDMVYQMDYLDELLDWRKPSDILGMIAPCNRFSLTDEWFWFDGYGHLNSSDNPVFDKASPVSFCLDDMVRYIVENHDPLENDSIAAALAEG